MSSSSLLFFLNGVKTVVTDVQPEVTLLEFLRDKGLTGTKLGCGEVGNFKNHSAPHSFCHQFHQFLWPFHCSELKLAVVVY